MDPNAGSPRPDSGKGRNRGIQAFVRGLRQYISVLFGRDTPAARRFGYAAAGGVTLIGVMAVLLLLYSVLLIPFTPSVGELRKAKSERATVVYSADGEKLVEFRPVNRQWVGLEEIAPEVRMALLATEDRRFYDHRGVDVRRIGGAMLRNLRGDRQGASTLTQQLARNIYPGRIGRRVTLTRKLKELVTTIKIEGAFTKDEILETYLNTVPFLYDAYGIELAARTYFGTTAAELDILQAATLVGMLKGTAYYNPVRHPERALERRNLVLRQMVIHGSLQQDRYDAIADAPLGVRFERQPRMQSRAPHFTEHVRRWLHQWADRRGYNIYRDSLVVHTSLDMRLQQAGQQAVSQWLPALQAIADYEWSRPDVRLVSRSPQAYRGAVGSRARFSYLWNDRPELVRAFIRGTPQYRAAIDAGMEANAVVDSLRSDASFMAALDELKTRLETGFVAMHPGTGRVLAWIGSHDFSEVPYDHVIRARRQPGSTFKPIVYAAALESGWRPDDTLTDEEIEVELANGEIWRPTNPGGSTGRPITLTQGLAQSKNTVTAQLIQEVGVRRVVRLARRMGVEHSRLDEVPSLALGTSDVSLLEMVTVYATLASGGIYRPPITVERIEDRSGRTVYEARTRERRVLSEETALRVVDMMRDVVDGGTGGRIRSTFGIREDVAGKTGTTQGNADGWFIGMHPELVAGSWVGFSDPRVSFRSSYWGAGGNNALLVVGDFYQRAFRHPETRLVGMRFTEAPEYDETLSLRDRLRGWALAANDWISATATDAFDWVLDRVLGGERSIPDTDPGPAVGPEETPPPRTLRADDDRMRAEADSLAQVERDSIRMESVLRRLELEAGGRLEGRDPVELGREPETDDAETEAAAEPPGRSNEAGGPPSEPPGRREGGQGPPGRDRGGPPSWVGGPPDG